MRKSIVTLSVAAVIGVGALAGCGSAKYSEQYKDADRGSSNTASADTGTMPDGFSNFASKCDHGNRVYVLFHEDSAYGGIAVVPNATGC